MAVIKLKQKTPPPADEAEGGKWRPGKTSAQRPKLRAELERLEGVVLQQSKKLEAYASLYNGLLGWMGRTQQADAADRLREHLDRMAKDDMRVARQSNLRGAQPSPDEAKAGRS